MRSLIEESNSIEEEYKDDEIVPVDGDEERTDYTLVELFVEILIYGIIGAVLILLFSSKRIYNLSGFLVGIVISLFMLWHIDWTIKRAMDGFESGAKSVMVKHYVIRTLVCVGLMSLVIISRKGNIILMIVGIMGLKVAVYLQPITDKLFLKIKKGG